MKGQQVLERIKPYTWLLIPVLGIGLGLSLGTVLMLKRQAQPETSREPAIATAVSPAVSPSVSPSPRVSPSPSPSVAKSPEPQIAASSSPQPRQPLTPEQEALNRQNIEAFMASRPSIDSLIEMRVVIGEGLPSLSLRTSMDAVLFDESGKQLQTIAAEQTYSVQPSGNSLRLNSSPLPQMVMIDPSPNGLFYLGDKGYRGRLLLIAEAGNVWAVNFVNMRSYLYSVVGSEVSPSWDMEALKAQAVAARSYALTYHFKPIHDAFDIGATQRHQVYRGIEREADTIRQAVDATAGEYVSHQGGVVRSLYAASDDIVMSVFQGQGMSQLGALNLANQGYTYQQILSNYYPGTKVGRIEQDIE
jgi:stage II sporulation protein D